MRNLIVTTSLLVLFDVAFAVPIQAETTLFPTGVFPADVVSVQSAVDHGGTVFLKAVNAAGIPTPFNFGPAVTGSGGVDFSRDVTIVGETVSANVMTTIRGGDIPFISFNRVRVGISGLFFDGPMGAALLVLGTNGAVFSHNKIVNIVGLPWFFGALKSQAVWSTSGLFYGQSGGIIVEDNVIENSLGDLGYGLALFGVDTEIRIARNTISGANAAGIFVGQNTQPITVEDNVVVPGPGFTFNPNFPEFGNGIFATLPLGGAFFIKGNVVRCDNPLADGIVLDSSVLFAQPNSNAIVEKNTVTMHNSVLGGISLYESVTHSVVRTNHVSGDGAFALDTQGFLDIDLAEFNTFQGNNISNFHSTVADVFFDVNSRNNVLVGNSGSVIDLGLGDRITGFTPMGGGKIGQQIRGAQSIKRAALRSLLTVEGTEGPAVRTPRKDK